MCVILKSESQKDADRIFLLFWQILAYAPKKSKRGLRTTTPSQLLAQPPQKTKTSSPDPAKSGDFLEEWASSAAFPHYVKFQCPDHAGLKSSTRIKDEGIAIRHSRGRILFYTAGSGNGLEGSGGNGSRTKFIKKESQNRQKGVRNFPNPTKTTKSCITRQIRIQITHC